MSDLLCFSHLYNIGKGFIENAYEVDRERAFALFDRFNKTSFDIYILSKISGRLLIPYFSGMVQNGIDKGNIDTVRSNITEMIIDNFYETWLRIIEVVSEKYNVFDVAIEHYTEKENRKENNTLTSDNTTQNKSNSFDDTETESNTDKIESGGNSTSENILERGMTYDKTSTGALYTPMELLEKEIAIREKTKIYDIVTNDIKSMITLDIY